MKTPIPELTAYRKAESLSLEALATKLEINKSTLLRWENGDTPIPVGRLGDLEQITGVPRQKLRPDIFGEVAA